MAPFQSTARNFSINPLSAVDFAQLNNEEIRFCEYIARDCLNEFLDGFTVVDA
ncbi:MAG: hypothetical protein LBU32_17715 [Clostridiales bacterium]|jgi:hypothetical protein|nr:hypothetical protein [Clostridiales bacterium]